VQLVMNENEMSADEPVMVHTTNDYYEAEVIKNVLQGEGIHCELDGERQAGLAEVLPIGVLVRARDADRARRIIELHEQRD